jgi:hypothetical protein
MGTDRDTTNERNDVPVIPSMAQMNIKAVGIAIKFTIEGINLVVCDCISNMHNY